MHSSQASKRKRQHEQTSEAKPRSHRAAALVRVERKRRIVEFCSAVVHVPLARRHARLHEHRRDALLGASEAALAVERICRSQHHIIGTVGQLEAFPGAVNVVPGEAHLSVDLRGELDGERDRVWDEISRELDDIMGRRGLRWQAREVHNAPAVRCGLLLQDVVREGIVHAAPRRSDEPPVIFSRAGHDAMAIGSITDVGMLFLRNPDGVSHHPDEAVSAADVALGIRALTESVLQLAADRL